MRVAALFLIVLTIAGCATGAALLDASNSAELCFAQENDPKGYPGGFEQLDGKRIAGYPSVIRVPPGEHTIVYNCPNVVSMDFRPEVRATFEAGQHYVLECGANVQGVVHKR
jgi:hypothetical protein